MSQPTLGDLHVNRPLTNLSVAWEQAQELYIQPRVFAPVPVQFKSDLYWKYYRGDWYRTDTQVRAPGTESAGTGWRVTTDSYNALPYAIHTDISDQDRANSDGAFDLDADATEFLTQDILIKRDRLFATKALGTGIWTGATGGGDLTGVSGAPGANQFKQWDASGSTPIEDFRKQMINMAAKTGYKPNVLCITPEVWGALSDNAELLDRIKYTEKGIVGTDLIASLLNLDRVEVAWAVENTAVENQDPTTETMGFIFSKAALLAYVNPNPGIRKPSAGYCFEWSGLTGQVGGRRMKKFRMEHLASDRIEAETAFDIKVVAAELGAFYTSATA